MTEATQTIVERLEKEIRYLQSGGASGIVTGLSLSKDAKAEIERLQAELSSYKEWHADSKRLVRELDVVINGEDGAAPQASLCDVVAQINVDWPRLRARAAELEKLVYVPGLWRCPKCEFQLIQANLNANDGSVTSRDEPGDRCPNCDGPLWRVTERDAGNKLVDDSERLQARVKELEDVRAKTIQECSEIARRYELEAWGVPEEQAAARIIGEWIRALPPSPKG